MNYQAEINEYEALLDTPEAQAVLQAEEWTPLASVPVPPAFDPEWLPQVPRDMADAVTRLRKKRIPFGMPALCALGASSACACGRVTIQVNQGWNEASQLYLAGIAPPGAAKSPVMEAMTGRLIALQAEENRRSQIEIAREQAALSVLEAERAAFVKKKRSAQRLSRKSRGTKPQTRRRKSSVSSRPCATLFHDSLKATSRRRPCPSLCLRTRAFL